MQPPETADSTIRTGAERLLNLSMLICNQLGITSEEPGNTPSVSSSVPSSSMDKTIDMVDTALRNLKSVNEEIASKF